MLSYSITISKDFLHNIHLVISSLCSWMTARQNLFYAWATRQNFKLNPTSANTQILVIFVRLFHTLNINCWVWQLGEELASYDTPIGGNAVKHFFTTSFCESQHLDNTLHFNFNVEIHLHKIDCCQ